MTDTSVESARELRKRAEKKLREAEDAAQETVSAEAAKQLLHELRVHQIELEMQNEELRRSQEDLETSRSRYFDLYNLAPVGYLTLSEEGRIQEANLTCSSLLGVARSSLVKRPLSSFIFSEDQDRYYLYRQQLTDKEGPPRICELRMVRADGSLFWARLQAIPAQESDGTLGCRMVISDLTEQQLAEIEVRKARELWEQTFDAIDDIVTVHDLDMRIIRANRAAGVLTQMDPAELIGKWCYEVFRGADEPCHDCPEILARMTQTNQQANIYYKNLRKTFTVTSVPLLEQSGIVGFVAIAKDITDYLQMEERLRQSQKMEAVGVLAGGISHDFNNILVPILGYAELAESRIAADDPLRSDLQQIIKGALRAKDMIAQILAVSRKAPQKKQSFQPQLVVREVLQLLRASLPATIEIKTKFADDCGMILADPTQLHQIVLNLCRNAQYAMNESGGVLQVSLAKTIIGKEDSRLLDSGLVPGVYSVLEVSDSGCGMNREILEQIFEPYFTTKGQGKGTGLGLSVVHGIVKSYHGHIAVQSEPGKGTSFQVYLPSIAEELFLKEDGPLLPVAAGAECILVVDDEEVITNMFKTILAQVGYQVIAFNNSLEALAFIVQDPTAFDLLLTDMSMPDLTGLELIQKVLAVRPDLPVILCSGFNKLVNKKEARALGIHVCLEKPVSVRELSWAIRKALDEK
ncbi:MAG: PAS domain S-box protein [Desulfoarculaceae bacterium]|nr:PAS domain S-box protein [Desulfoarculaceae bacterium]